MRAPRRAALLLVGAALCAALAGCSHASGGRWFQPSKPTIDVHATAPCPATLGRASDVPDHSGGSATLLPGDDQPDAALSCSFENLALTAQTTLTAAKARRLASVINKIDLTKPNGNFNCPAVPVGTATVIAFRYGGTDDVDVWWNRSGCGTLDNGRLGAFEGANPSFYRGFTSTFEELMQSPAHTPVPTP